MANDVMQEIYLHRFYYVWQTKTLYAHVDQLDLLGELGNKIRIHGKFEDKIFELDGQTGVEGGDNILNRYKAADGSGFTAMINTGKKRSWKKTKRASP